jgi:ribosome-associated protein
MQANLQGTWEFLEEGGNVSSNPSESLSERERRAQRSLELAMAAVRTAAENGGRDITLLDMRQQSTLFDYFVIASGTSRRQLHGMSEEIDHTLEDDLKDKRMGIEGYDASRWVLLDYGSVVIHLFDDETREFYALEALWADAKAIDISDVIDRP